MNPGAYLSSNRQSIRARLDRNAERSAARQVAAGAQKRMGARRLRHASRIAKPKRPVVWEGRALEDDDAEGRTLAEFISRRVNIDHTSGRR